MTPSAVTTDLDFDRCYRAVQARDTRFDGQFFVCVSTTGIYCRPSCPAQTPRPHNVSFVLTGASAQQQGYRACRRCAPDAVPGSPRWNAGADTTSRAMRLIADGVIEREGVGGLADRLRYSPRHLTRVLTDHLGAGPLALARAHRATNARILIQCTTLPMSEIAFASGFASVRQFNDTVRDVFAMTPTQLRSARGAHRDITGTTGGITLRLAYRPPYRWAWMRWFLTSHAVAGVETVTDGPDWTFRRVLSLPHGTASVLVSPQADHVRITLRHLDMRDLGVAVNRIRRLLDLDADVAAAEEVLGSDPALGPLVVAAPGIRLPGSVDPAETIIRTMIGQQISVAAARVHLDNLVDALGEPTDWPDDQGRCFPTPASIAEHGRSVLRGPRRRIDSIVAVAAALADNRVEPHPGMTASDLYAQLVELPGIGPWTADIVAMRVTGDPDIALTHDLVVVHAMNELGIDRGAAEGWSPWRSYASMHLWRHRLAAAGA
ncbi:AlkA N-terminal domain-containing protein [Gordonia sp. ABSL1-1]|uniref:DNA-3-methyladenine glycosylase 2 family protein n=1 Tax=Gordonia sp. ABSL1-1 TaxID=3053923 RepID=UPI00257323FD|nr:AlkA N-terminal domain-containing protein [Gordonia sp. ABSL1-1]MDL9935757.1 AlkA N-terminal domain-containing protein [Gordonia sp. ABSL1-1]